METKHRLATALREAAAQAQPANAAKYEAFAKRAETGEFDDFESPHATPCVQLNNELTAAGFTRFAARVRDGEFDATKEESSGREAFERLLGEGRAIGDGPVEGEYYAKMTAIVQGLDEVFNGQIGGPGRHTGFVLLVFPFGEREGRCNYMSNGANRQDIVTLFKEQIKRFEGQPDVSGRA